MRRIWQTELDSHIADLADELGSEAEARRRFGNVAAIGQQLSAIHPWLAAYGDWIVIGAILFASLPLYIGTTIFVNTIPGLIAERLLVWWWGLIVILGSTVLVKWQWQLTTPDKKNIILYALSTGWLISAVLTAILDINNFETTIYNALFSLVIGTILWFRWFKLSLNQKKILLYSSVSLVIWFAWREQGWLESFIFPGCLYLQPDPLITSPNQCTQLTWLHPLLLLIYLTLTVSIWFMLQYCYKLWQHSSVFYRKIITTTVWLFLPVTPLLISGINKSGTLDALPWKQDIYQSYVDILGRRPEQKDYDFYAQTRSYQHMSAVREVLYQSEERRIKITLLFREFFQRDPSDAELEYYANSKLTIQEIAEDLQRPQ